MRVGWIGRKKEARREGTGAFKVVAIEMRVLGPEKGRFREFRGSIGKFRGSIGKTQGHRVAKGYISIRPGNWERE